MWRALRDPYLSNPKQSLKYNDFEYVRRLNLSDLNKTDMMSQNGRSINNEYQAQNTSLNNEQSIIREGRLKIKRIKKKKI